MKRDTVAGTKALDLTFRGLEWCDGCGNRLVSGDRLCGLCPDCQEPKAKGRTPRQKPRPVREGEGIPGWQFR